MKIANFIYPTVLYLIISCQTRNLSQIKPTYNKGGYTISISKNELMKEDSSIVYGYIKDYTDKNLLTTSIIKIGCITINVDSKGFYKLKSKTIENTFLTGISIGYRTIETEYFKLDKGDSINIDFFLAPDDRPLINCEGEKN